MKTIDQERGDGRCTRNLQRAFGANIRDKRLTEGLNKASFSLMASISRPTLDAIESGQGDPKFSTMHRISEALGVDLGELLKDGSLSRWRE